MAALWPSIEGSVDQLTDSYPAKLKEAFGITELSSVERYVDAEMLSLIVPLAVSVFAIRGVVRATVGTEEAGHLDTLLSWPVSRTVLALGTLLVTGVSVAVVLALAGRLADVEALRAVSAFRLYGSAVQDGLDPLHVLALVLAGAACAAGGVLLLERRDVR